MSLCERTLGERLERFLRRFVSSKISRFFVLVGRFYIQNRDGGCTWLEALQGGFLSLGSRKPGLNLPA